MGCRIESRGVESHLYPYPSLTNGLPIQMFKVCVTEKCIKINRGYKSKDILANFNAYSIGFVSGWITILEWVCKHVNVYEK